MFLAQPNQTIVHHISDLKKSNLLWLLHKLVQCCNTYYFSSIEGPCRRIESDEYSLLILSFQLEFKLKVGT